MSRIRSRLLILFVAVVLGVPAGFLSAHAIRVPTVKALADYQPAIITRIFDRHGVAYAEYSIQKRIIVGKKDMSPHLVNAIVATEDAEFYRHGGINPKAIARAALKDIIARKKLEGASTITQQLAKMIFLTPEKSFRRKINEAFLSVQIEKDFPKDQIFEFYANQVYFGHGAYGVEQASRFYFGKHARDLTLTEAALIAGLIRRPGSYSPLINPEAAKRRRNHVLWRLVDERYISRDQYQQALAAPIVLGTYKEEMPKIGAYFAEEVRQYIEHSERFGVENLYQRGLRVHTTLDLQIQQIVETALQRGLRAFDQRRGFRKPARNLIAEGLDPESYRDPAWTNAEDALDQLYPAVVTEVRRQNVKVRVGKDEIVLPPDAFAWTRRKSMEGMLRAGDLVHVRQTEDARSKQQRWVLDQLPQVQGAAVVLDVKSGEIRALAGGYSYYLSKFNRATQSRRQTGSSFKPLVFAAAFEKGLTPADTLFDAPIEIRQDAATSYTPKNYGGRYAGIVTIQRALELSINIPAVKTLMMAGIDHVIDFTRRVGITADLPPYPSLALGSAGVSPLEMTAAYNVFVNHGVYVKPRRITRITDHSGRVLEEPPAELSEATQPQVAYEVAYMLKGTIDRGTAYAANRLAEPLAGKTGTTNGYTDGWFIGFSPEFTVGVWMGYDDPSRSLGGGATGSATALPIWIDIFRQFEERNLRTGTAREFEAPPGVVIVPMDLRSGRRGVGPCTRVVTAAFITGQEPDQDCSGEMVAVGKLPYYMQRAFYQPKESEPIMAADDASAMSGEGAESPAPEWEEEAPAPAEQEPPGPSNPVNG
ncbi:MAG TPA: PBP1A family penicillin-binding protein [Thermoanaerobaculia bacterium]|nr:PBP1A family penicillin-binding protein [Thermoanaerobaculia bacterium]